MRFAKKFVVREEPFGFTLSNRDTLHHEFIARDEFKQTLKALGIKAKDYDYLPIKKGKSFRKDIIYSPTRIYYELTLACNLRCKFCFNNSGKPRNKELSTKEVIKSLKDFRQANVIGIRFTGGEFTCRPDWFEIFKAAKDLGFIVSGNTNAAYFDLKINKQLAELDLEQVTVSIDGVKAHHDQNRGSGTFDRTLCNLKEMHKLGVKLRINTLLNRYSINDLEPMAEIASKYAKEINFFTVRFMGRGAELESEYSIDWKEFCRFAKKAEQVRKKYPKLSLLTFCQVTNRSSVGEERHKKLGLKIGTTSGTTTLNVTSDGNFWAGGYTPYIDPKLSLGNVKKNGVFDVWQKSRKLEEMRDKARDLKLFCRKCPEFRKRCPGPVFEIELYREIHPESKNPYCIHGSGPPLLTKIRNVNKLPYRDNVSCIVFQNDRFLLVRLNDWPKNFWKFPQGGVKQGETEKEAVIRELTEELGTDKFRIIVKSPFVHKYDWDRDSVEKAGFRWRGQKQKFYLVEFLGEDKDIKINTEEVQEYKWVKRYELAKHFHHKHKLFANYNLVIKKTLNRCLKPQKGGGKHD